MGTRSSGTAFQAVIGKASGPVTVKCENTNFPEGSIFSCPAPGDGRVQLEVGVVDRCYLSAQSRLRR
ncbi:MAG TPA: hypothetical protein VIM11_09910 [Tepidisphaeraceae bacterium]